MEGKLMMPLQVRIFWWLSIAIVAYSIVLTVLAVQYIQHHDFLPTIAKLPVEIRAQAYRTDISVRLISAVVWCGLILCFAWLAAFRHRNWARWAFVFLFIIQGVYEIWGAIEFHKLSGRIVELMNDGWWAYIFLVLVVAAATCVFSRRSHWWFETSG